MPGPLDAALAAVMVATAASCLVRGLKPSARPRPRREADLAHAAMAAAMAAMFLGVLRAPLATTGVLVFALAGLWFARAAVVEVAGGGPRGLVDGHGVWVAVTCLAMVAMLVPAGHGGSAAAAGGSVAMPGMPGMGRLAAGATTLGAPLALGLAVGLVALALSPARCRVAGRTPVLATSCQVAMGLTMAYAVLVMAS